MNKDERFTILKWFIRRLQRGIMERYFSEIIILFIFIAGCSDLNERDKISFKTPLSEVEDSIKVMNTLINSYNEVNYYIDDANILFIGTNELGRIDSSFLAQLRLNPSNYTNTDIRIFSIILFLKNNEINSFFKHRELGVIVYDYKPTKEDRFEDVRYIILNDGTLDINSSLFKNSQYILDKKGKLILFAPKDRKR